MENIKAVIFDLDNTILDRTRTFHRFTTSFIDTYFPQSQDNEVLINRIIELDQDGYKDKNILFAELLEEFPWTAKPEIAELLEYYSVHYVKNALLMEQAAETIAYIRHKYKLGLITNGKTAIQYGKVDRLGIRSEFDFILVSEEVGVKKPDNQIFEMAIGRLGLKAEECLYIGDHPRNDIQGASQAGMKTIWIQVNQPWIEELTVKPAYTIKKLGELVEIL